MYNIGQSRSRFQLSDCSIVHRVIPAVILVYVSSYVSSLIRKAYMELALVCFGSCQLIQLVLYGSLLPNVDEDAKTKVSFLRTQKQSLFCLVSCLWHLPRHLPKFIK